jgi:hypothetical protein
MVGRGAVEASRHVPRLPAISPPASPKPIRHNLLLLIIIARAYQQIGAPVIVLGDAIPPRKGGKID